MVLSTVVVVAGVVTNGVVSGTVVVSAGVGVVGMRVVTEEGMTVVGAIVVVLSSPTTLTGTLKQYLHKETVSQAHNFIEMDGAPTQTAPS